MTILSQGVWAQQKLIKDLVDTLIGVLVSLIYNNSFDWVRIGNFWILEKYLEVAKQSTDEAKKLAEEAKLIIENIKKRAEQEINNTRKTV